MINGWVGGAHSISQRQIHYGYQVQCHADAPTQASHGQDWPVLALALQVFHADCNPHQKGKQYADSPPHRNYLKGHDIVSWLPQDLDGHCALFSFKWGKEGGKADALDMSWT